MIVEQRINLKFYFRLGRTSTGALKLFQEVYGDDTIQELIFLNGTGGSKREERRWKMITGVGGHPQAEHMKMLRI